MPEVGSEAPEFFLPSAQGGQLRLSMRTVRGPVVVAFYDRESEEDERYFKELAGVEDEINLAGGSVVAIGIAEPDEARDFARRTGLKSYVLYDYARVAGRDYGVLERPRKGEDRARPAVFLVGDDNKVVEAWVGERPDPKALLAKVSEITGLPKAPEEAEEKPERPKRGAAGKAEGEADADADGAEKPKKMTAEERERIKAERRAARAEGRSLKTGQPAAKPADGGDAAGEKPERPRLSPEERERRRAERKAAREAEAAGSDAPDTENPAQDTASEAAPKPKMTAEERERVKAERRAARAEGRSLKTPQPGTAAPEASGEAGKKPAEGE